MNIFLTRYRRFFSEQPKQQHDPHDVEGRKWFRRMLIAVCIAGYAIILLQSALGARLGIRHAVMTEHELAAMREGCTQTLVPISKGVDMVQYECRKEFKDGSTYRREGM